MYNILHLHDFRRIRNFVNTPIKLQNYVCPSFPGTVTQKVPKNSTTKKIFYNKTLYVKSNTFTPAKTIVHLRCRWFRRHLDFIIFEGLSNWWKHLRSKLVQKFLKSVKEHYFMANLCKIQNLNMISFISDSIFFFTFVPNFKFSRFNKFINLTLCKFMFFFWLVFK